MSLTSTASAAARPRHLRIVPAVPECVDDPLSLRPKPVRPTPVRLRPAGAAGELRLAGQLAALSTSIVTLPDRLARRPRAALDQLVVGPDGVFVVGARRGASGPVGITWPGRGGRGQSGRNAVIGRDRVELIDTMTVRIAVVRAALAGSAEFRDTPITALLCFVNPESPLPGTEDIDGVRVADLPGLAGLLSAGDRLDRSARGRLARHLDDRLPGPRAGLPFAVDQKPGNTGRSPSRISAPVIPFGVCSGSRRP